MTTLSNQFILTAAIVATTSVLWGSPVLARPCPAYGKSMMTQDERAAHRQLMHSAKTDAERDQIRADHRAKMQARAKERGVTAPGQRPCHGMGKDKRRHGRGKGRGQGMGTGAKTQ